MCYIKVGWEMCCQGCGRRRFVYEFELNPPFAPHDQEICWAPDQCNCRSRAYLWTFYNINPLFFDSHHLFSDRNRQFYQICPTCKEDLKKRGDCSLRRALEESSSEPENRDAYRPGWCAPDFRPLGNPPPLPQHGEAFLEGCGEDSGSNTSVASTPRPEGNLPLAASAKAIDPSNGDYSASGSGPAASTPVQHVEGSSFPRNTADKLDYLEFLDKEYRQYMQHTRRGSTNRRDDDLQTGVFTRKV